MSTRLDLLIALGSLALPCIGVTEKFFEPGSAAQTARNGGTLADQFIAAYDRWRAGDESAAPLAKSIADEMSASLGRTEVPKIVAHYAALSKAERAAGLAIEQRVNALREELGRARDDGLVDNDWDSLRAEIEPEIEAACADSLGIADLGARAYALALRAEYRVARLEPMRSSDLDPEVRAQIAELISKDAHDSLDCFERFDIVRGALNPRSTIARIEYFLGRLGPAHAAYRELAKGARAVGDDMWLVEAYGGLIAIANERGDELEADRCLDELGEASDAREDWRVAGPWAMHLIRADRAGEARDFLDRFQAPDPAADSLDAAHIRRGLAFVRAEALLRLGELDLARRASAEAAREAELQTGDSFAQKYLDARIELAAGNPQAAIDLLGNQKLLSAQDARKNGAARRLLCEAYLKLENPRAGKAEVERALELAQERRQLAFVEPLVSEDEARRFNFIGEWEGAGLESVALLARANLELNDPLSAALASEDWQSRSLRGINEENEALLARAGMAPVYHSLTSAHLEAWASTVELGLVTWVFGSDSGVVVHVKALPTGKLDCLGETIPFGREKLRETVRWLRDRATAGQDTTDLSRQLRDALLPKNTLAHIGHPKADTDRLLLLLHGPLEALPFELLGLDDKRFDEELCLLALPGLPSLEPGPRLPASAFESWRLLGSPVDGAESDARPKILLSGASTELAELSKLRPTAKVWPDAAFQRPALERALRSSDCVHVATHLEAKNGEERARFPAMGLRLCDKDVASARQIVELGPKLPLVVLSACETGGGRYSDGEGLFGVARAFLESGTRNLVVTLWPVQDKAAREFALSFHRALLGGAAPSQATRLARAELMAAKYSSSEWAAFRFIGRD